MSDPIWTLQADIDLQREFENQEDYLEGKGFELFEVKESGNNLLRENPFAGAIYETPIRQLVLKNPRFGIFYVPEVRGVIIHALCNLAQPRENILRHLGIRSS